MYFILLFYMFKGSLCSSSPSLFSIFKVSTLKVYIYIYTLILSAFCIECQTYNNSTDHWKTPN